MRIRSITYFGSPESISRAGKFLQTARQAYQQAGYEVQTLRFAAPPFASWMPSLTPGAAAETARGLQVNALAAGIGYVSLGPAAPEDAAAWDAIIPMLNAAPAVFCSGIMGDSQRGVFLPAVFRAAEIVREAAEITSDGFGNLRFTAMANVAPGCPFFPAGYAAAGEEHFALAMEAADLAVEVFSHAGSLKEASSNLIEKIQSNAKALTEMAGNMIGDDGPGFCGVDFTLSPFPDEAISLGTAIERLGVPAVGLNGSLAAAAFITSCIDQAEFHRTGFNGLLLPVLEDATLARRAADGSLTVNDLLMYAAVCGTGLDTIPLPGDLSRGQIASILLDLAALSCRLEKPLTARLMPIPGKKQGEETGFDFAYFANSRVMGLRAENLSGLFSGEEWLPIFPRHKIQK